MTAKYNANANIYRFAINVQSILDDPLFNPLPNPHLPQINHKKMLLNIFLRYNRGR